MKIKKEIIIVIIVALVVFIPYIIINLNNKDNGGKFYLDSKYYNNGEFIDVNDKEVESLLNSKSNFILFTYNNYCTLPIPCNNIFESTMKKYNIDMLQITFEDFKNTSLYQNVLYAPSVIIIRKGKIVSYLKADSDEDYNKYQDSNEFDKWLNEYVILQK